MEDLTKETSKSLDVYFNTLSRLGYIDYTQVDKLLVTIFINDIIDGAFGDLISELDYKTLNNCLYCMYGTSCLLPYPTYINDTMLPKNYTTGEFRITEDLNVRSSEQNDIRIT